MMHATKPVWIAAGLAFSAGGLIGALLIGPPALPDSARPALPVARPDPGVASAETTDDEPQMLAAWTNGSPEAPAGDRTAGLPDPDADAGIAPLDPRVADALAAWGRTEARVAALQVRLARLEETLGASPLEGAPADPRPEPPGRPRTPVERRDALVSAGVDPVLAEEIVVQEGRAELDRLSLRDQAVREGWIGTDRYREELARFSRESRGLREEIGEAAYDRYLYATGEDNRVRVTSVIAGSAAEAAGLEPGDLIESYAGERLFDGLELRDGTTQGERGELVAVRVRRGQGTLDAWVPRGPLGIRMDMTRAQPAP